MNCFKTSRKNKGFTLVELIVVLVILAILAAILIPALLGYIDRAREKQDILDARSLLVATQAELTEYYATGADSLKPGDPIIPGTTPHKKNGDVDATATKFAEKVLKTADKDQEKPYVFMVAVGSNHDKNIQSKWGNSNNVSKHDQYTVYYALYIKDAEGVPYYYYNGNWTKKNPRGKGGTTVDIFDEYNYVTTEGTNKGMRLQYYLISNGTGKKIENTDFWDLLKITLDEKWNK